MDHAMNRKHNHPPSSATVTSGTITSSTSPSRLPKGLASTPSSSAPRCWGLTDRQATRRTQPPTTARKTSSTLWLR